MQVKKMPAARKTRKGQTKEPESMEAGSRRGSTLSIRRKRRKVRVAGVRDGKRGERRVWRMRSKHCRGPDHSPSDWA